MRQLIAITVQMRRLKNEVEETDEAILRGLVEQMLSGTLPARDLYMSEEINRQILGKDSFRRREDRLKDFLEENQSSLDIVVHDGLVNKTEGFVLSVSTRRATALCGPSFSGKSTIIEVRSYPKIMLPKGYIRLVLHPLILSKAEIGRELKKSQMWHIYSTANFCFNKGLCMI